MVPHADLCEDSEMKSYGGRDLRQKKDYMLIEGGLGDKPVRRCHGYRGKSIMLTETEQGRCVNVASWLDRWALARPAAFWKDDGPRHEAPYCGAHIIRR